ncbi:MAG: SAM-dependent methyltransferase [Candidatus Rokuibacteriota bacterium]
MRPERRWPGAIVAVLALAAAACGQVERPGFASPDIIFLATPDSVGAEMLRLAGVAARDVVYDLGSGDGRLVIAAARDFGARGVGVELEPDLVQTSRETALKAGVAGRTRFLWQDIFAADIREATVVTLYLGESVNLRLRPRLLAELAPGTRVVSHKFGMGDWSPDRTLRARGPDGEHVLRLWLVPAQVGGRWQVTLLGRASTLTLDQRYQTLAGSLEGGGRLAVTGRLTGDQVRLAAGVLVLEGRVSGDRMSGRATESGGTGDWTAVRTR